MPEIIRVARSSYNGRDRDDYVSDDEFSSTITRSRPAEGSYRTVQRYRVTPVRDEPPKETRRTEVRSSQLEIVPRNERLEVDRRVERFVDVPERPRSAIEYPRSTIIERSYVEREPVRDPERERTRTVVYERERPREPLALRPWERETERPWERDRETDIRIEKRTERTTERKERREEPYELERYQRETEYYDRPEPAPQPIIIRQRAPEPQQIIVQEAPPPLPIVLPRQEEEQGFQVIRRREEVVEEPPRPRQEDEYYYRREVRDVGPRRDEDFAVAAYDRRQVRSRDSVSSDDSDYVRRERRIVRRRSSSPHHKRHLAEGALAGAGAAALLANHREKQGNASEHRGREIVGGAALGAIGAEVLTRARSRYRDRQEGRSRSRSSSRHSHSKVKTALGLAVAGIAAAAAVKYAQKRSADKEELGRGRSRTRSVSRRRASGDLEGGQNTSIHDDPKHRAAQMAKAGMATAAVAGVIEHFRNKSRKRSGSRSKSRLRTGAEIAASGLAGAAVAGLYESRKAKEDKEQEAERIKKERRRSRSRTASIDSYSDDGVDPELGMVEYGTHPVYAQQPAMYQNYDPAAAGAAAGASAAYGAAYGATKHHRSHHQSPRRYSSSSSDGDRRRSSRSRSRVQDIAVGALGTGAAAIGISQYKKRKEKKEAERERERRRYEEEHSPDNYYANNNANDNYSPSPPHASGGSYFPDPNVQTHFPPPPTAPTAGYTQPATTSTTHANDGPIPPYNPADYANQQAPADQYGYPAHPADNYPPHPRDDHVSSSVPRQSPVVNTPANAFAVPPYFLPPPPSSEAVSQIQDAPNWDDPRDREGRVTAHSLSSVTSPESPTTPETPHNRSVTFAPLSPTSSRLLDRIHKNKESLVEITPPSDPEQTTHQSRRRRRRRLSDPSSDRPNVPRKYRRHSRDTDRSPSPNSSGEVDVLPDRFDGVGRPIEREGGVVETEMVERLVHGFGDVIGGKSSWKDLLRGLIDEAGGHEAGSGPGRR